MELRELVGLRDLDPLRHKQQMHEGTDEKISSILWLLKKQSIALLRVNECLWLSGFCQDTDVINGTD